MSSAVKQWGPLLAWGSILFVGYSAYLAGALQFDMMRADVLGYWEESFNWSKPFSVWWVPGYPWAIALVRAITLNTLPPIVIMSAISGVSFLAALLLISAIGEDLRIPSPSRVVWLFAGFPFVGLTYVAYPVADGMAIALLLFSYFLYTREKWGFLAIALSATALTHKATWYFIVPFVIMAFVRHKQSRKILPLSAVPLLLLIVAGAFYRHDVFWFIRWSTDNLLASRSTLPVLDGLLGPLLGGGAAKIMKGLLVLTIFLSACGVLFYCYRRKLWLGVAISFGTVLMGLTVNQYEIWALVRFSKILCVAIPIILASQPVPSWVTRMLQPKNFAAVVLACLATNLVYGYYLAKVFYK